LRGVAWVAVPTTLLAMVDASVGGKTGVDFGPAKNSVGAFWQPRGVLCDARWLETEEPRGFKSALAEVVKTALIGDPALFQLLERETPRVLARDPAVVSELVRRCVALKAWVVGSDEREAGQRATQNLGHTVGHALEAEGGYSRLTHGEAVSLGLVAALRLGARMGKTPPSVVQRTEQLLKSLGLPTAVEAEPVAEAAKLLGHDKKRAGHFVKFVFAEEVGQVSVEPQPVEELRQRVIGLASV
jgi:shikimate kinase/3-dehydroquinate synthase